MHDFYLAQQIFKTVLEYAKKNGFKNVAKIEIELGGLVEHGEEILPENLIHNFKLLAEKTIARDAKLEIKKIKGENWKLLDIEGNK